MNKKIKKVFEKMDPELQEAIKFLINDIQVKREINSDLCNTARKLVVGIFEMVDVNYFFVD